jgi:hypothetical protein
LELTASILESIAGIEAPIGRKLPAIGFQL